MQGKRFVWLTLIITALATAWRVLLLPSVAGDGTGLTKVSYPLLSFLLVAVALLLFLGRARAPFGPMHGTATRLTALSGILLGGGMVGVSVYDAYNWLFLNILPAPSNVVDNNFLDEAALAASLIGGFVGGVFLIALFCGWCKTPPAGLITPFAALVAASGVIAGAVLIVFTVRDWRVQTAQILDTAARRTLFIGLILAVAVGVLLIAACVLWMIGRRFQTGWLWLLPMLWIFARLVRYDILYATRVDVAPAMYEFVLYTVALFFLLSLASYMSGVQAPSKWMRGFAAATAVLAFSALFSRLILTWMGATVAAAYCPLPNVADGLLGLFALAVAGGVSEQKKQEEPIQVAE